MGKSEELEILLETEINSAEGLCFIEHWLNCHKIHAINNKNFTLANAFYKENSDHSGSCIFVKQGLMTKELNSLNEHGKEKSFGLSVIELVRYAIIVICICRNPDGKIDTFFNKLEMIYAETNSET